MLRLSSGVGCGGESGTGVRVEREKRRRKDPQVDEKAFNRREERADTLIELAMRHKAIGGEPPKAPEGEEEK
jgi:hypothetical protein